MQNLSLSQLMDGSIVRSNKYYNEKGTQHNHGHKVFRYTGKCSNYHEFTHLNVLRPACKPCNIKSNKNGYYENINMYGLYHRYTDGKGMRIGSEGCQFESDEEYKLEDHELYSS